MKRLIQIEFIKIRKFKAFWVLAGLYLLVMIFMVLGFSSIYEKILSGGPFAGGMVPSVNRFSENWQYLTYIASWSNQILAVLVIILTCMEFNHKTLRQSLINGLSRWEFFVSKVTMILVFSGIATLIIGLIIFIIGLMNMQDGDMDDVFDKMPFLLGFFLQLTGYAVVAFFWAIVLKKAGFALGIFILQSFMLENFTFFYYVDNFDWVYYLPIKSMDNLIQLPVARFIGRDVGELPPLRSVLTSLGYIFSFLGVSWWLIAKKDQ